MESRVPSQTSDGAVCPKTIWTVEKICELFDLPFNDLIYQSHFVHRESFDPNTLQLSTLLSIKTGGYPEAFHPCPQAKRYAAGFAKQTLPSTDEVASTAKPA